MLFVFCFQCNKRISCKNSFSSVMLKLRLPVFLKCFLVCLYYRASIQHEKVATFFHILKAFSVRHSSEYETLDRDRKMNRNI